MKQAMDARRRTLEAADADLRDMMTEHDETEDTATNVEKPAVPKSTEVVKPKTDNAGEQGPSKGSP